MKRITHLDSQVCQKYISSISRKDTTQQFPILKNAVLYWIGKSKKKKPVDRVWELRKKTSFKFKDKQFCAIRDPETGKLSTSRDETYQILLKYNKELLRKDKVQKSENKM